MNILPTVMGLLLIFACTFTLSLRKATLAQPVEKTYQAHIQASRKILNSYESLCYERMRGEKKEKQDGNVKTAAHREKQIEPLNLDCARLNLWPLLQDGKEKQPILYETAAHLLRTFYASFLFEGQPRFEYCLLDALLEAAKLANNEPNTTYLPLEKLALKDWRVKPLYSLQTVYYRMLRGTKKHQEGYPSLLEYFVIENKETHICMQHASAEMLTALFGPGAAAALFHELQESETPLLPERVREISTQNGKIGLSDEFLKLLDFQTSRHHTSGQKTLVQEEADVCLKQRVFLPS
jgi:hypothetical protein